SRTPVYRLTPPGAWPPSWVERTARDPGTTAPRQATTGVESQQATQVWPHFNSADLGVASILWL
ncbi:MAG: hypothetical protein LBH11_00485, partial [Propionibacteriaceae bacterium]|nr:hypothetical protein [Propionibacteriaceae bacterium]